MNPRIKDFAEHCDFYVGNEHYDKSYEEKQVLWVEKFAEMIVQECVNVIDRNRPYHSYNHLANDYMSGVEHGYKLSICEIKEYFGVEE